MTYQNDILLRTLRGEKTERRPVWMMRQAGRVLAEYRAVREKAGSFIALATTPELASEVTVQPVDIFGVDAAIIFSDILVVPEGMGLPYEMYEKQGPFFPKTIQTAADVEALHLIEPEQHLGYVMEAIRLTKQKLQQRVPLIGFAGAPWTIFAYMTEGKGSKTFSKAKAFLYQQPTIAHALLHKITQSTIAYLKGQIVAGADVLQLFDSWAGILSPESYRTFALPYIAQICEAIKDVPMIVFAKDAHFARAWLGELPCAAVGLDWTMEAGDSRRLIGADKVLQGNLDPCVLYADETNLRKEVEKMLRSFDSKHIVNLGHGLYPDISPAKAKLFVDTAKEISTELHLRM
ncbi:MAG: uroporphyrinogen decarboxylase [Cytophagales bacterium]|nr:MAG: uroporphyrinogen decarboxylase [Cytophagales bacterium]